jgi:glutaredoxin-related protein
MLVLRSVTLILTLPSALSLSCGSLADPAGYVTYLLNRSLQKPDIRHYRVVKLLKNCEKIRKNSGRWQKIPCLFRKKRLTGGSVVLIQAVTG